MSASLLSVAAYANTFCLSSVTADAFAKRRLKILLREGAAVSRDRNESVFSQGNVIKEISQSVFRIFFFFYRL